MTLHKGPYVYLRMLTQMRLVCTAHSETSRCGTAGDGRVACILHFGVNPSGNRGCDPSERYILAPLSLLMLTVAAWMIVGSTGVPGATGRVVHLDQQSSA